MENSMEVHQKIKNRTTTWSSNPTSEYQDLEEIICTHILILPLFSIAKNMQTTQQSIKRQMNKEMQYTCTIDYLFCLQKEENLPFVRTCMELKDIMISETSQSPKDK